MQARLYCLMLVKVLAEWGQGVSSQGWAMAWVRTGGWDSKVEGHMDYGERRLRRADMVGQWCGRERALSAG